MQFTETDRKFIRKIAAANDALEKRVKVLENAAKEKTNAHNVTPSPQILEEGARSGRESSIKVTFEPDSDVTKQQVLIESIYQTLRDICRKHSISTIDVHIDNTH